MKVKQRTAEELNKCLQEFLSQPHEVKKLQAEAKKIWESEQELSAKKNEDRWTALRDYSIKNDKGENRAIGNEILSALRSRLAKLQGNRCCYCRRWLQNIAHARPIEHVLSRNDYPQFSLHYWNLAVCCRDCNQLKSDNNWSLLPKDANEYPSEIPNHFHPRIHIFDGHVRYIRVETNNTSIAIYHGLTTQGRHLCREHLKTISQVDALFRNNRRITEAIERLQLAGEVSDPKATAKLREFIESLHTAIYRIASSS